MILHFNVLKIFRKVIEFSYCYCAPLLSSNILIGLSKCNLYISLHKFLKNNTSVISSNSAAYSVNVEFIVTTFCLRDFQKIKFPHILIMNPLGDLQSTA